MSNTHHHSHKHGSVPQGQGTKRRGLGYEYWGRDAYMGSDGEKIRRTRRNRLKRLLSRDLKGEE